jgi:putative hemolysin
MHLNPIQISSLEAPLPLSSCIAPHREAKVYPQHPEGVPPGVLRSGRYSVRFANSAEDLRDVQRLRFDVFNVELHEGLTESYATGLDQDAFDARCHHLMVCDDATGRVVGTYRLMTAELATREELYSQTEFDLSRFPEHVVAHGAEVGRACVASEHRNGRVLQLLWRGIARYLDWNDKRYVFGCCSVPTLDTAAIAALSLKLAREDRMHTRVHAPVKAALRGASADNVLADSEAALPPLFASYLRLGAKVCGGPAFDREFRVTDYLVLLDLRDVDTRTLSGLSAPGLWRTDATAA